MMTGGVMAAGAIVGGIAGSQKQGGGTQTTTNVPWSVQSPYLQSGFQRADDLYNSKAGTPWYTGELYAGLTPEQRAAMTGLNGFASGTGADTAAALRGAGGALLPGAATAAQQATDLYGRAMADPTQSNINAAGLYANNPYVDGMVDAASRDVVRNLNENELPSNSLNAEMGGNTNSSRSAMTDAILKRGAADRVADISSTLRGGLYSNGLDLAEQVRQAGLSAGLSANGQTLNGASLGGNLMGQGYSMDVNNLNIPLQTGNMVQQDQQNQDNANLQSWQANDQRQNDLLNNYWNIVGRQTYGSTSTTQLPTYGGGLMGGLMGAVGGASMGAGLMNGLGGVGGGSMGNVIGQAYTPPPSSWTAMPSNFVPPWQRG